MSLPEIVKQATRSKKLPKDFMPQATKALRGVGMGNSFIKEVLAGKKRLKEGEMKKVCNTLLKGGVKGLGTYNYGSTLVANYVKYLERRQQRFRFFQKQRADETGEGGQKERLVSIGEQRRATTSALSDKEGLPSALENKMAASSALEERRGVTSVFSKKPSPDAPPPAKTTRVNLPF